MTVSILLWTRTCLFLLLTAINMDLILIICLFLFSFGVVVIHHRSVEGITVSTVKLGKDMGVVTMARVIRRH